MTPEQIAKQRSTSYFPPYLKRKVYCYVEKHDDMTISKFIKDAVKEKVARMEKEGIVFISNDDLLNLQRLEEMSKKRRQCPNCRRFFDPAIPGQIYCKSECKEEDDLYTQLLTGK